MVCFKIFLRLALDATEFTLLGINLIVVEASALLHKRLVLLVVRLINNLTTRVSVS